MTIDGEEYWTDQTAEVEEADGQIEITSAEAKAADKIAVTLAEPVDADDTVITLTKGTDAFAIEAEWAETNDSVSLTTAAKLSKGTYTVTLASMTDETNTDSADVEVKDQTVTEIVILNDVALTNKDKDIAYAYYDVKDQYGKSMRSSTSITWAGSCTITPNKTNGQLKLTKVADGDDWVYGEKIYVTGVNTKTGVAKSKELTVGTEQNLYKIEMVGFVKKGTADIIDAKDGLPKGFKEGEYYMLFNAYDQNGDKLAADDIDKEDVTFITSDPLIIKELTKINEPNAITIGGEEYNAVEVTPGIKVATGGEVTIDAIANKTGNKTSVVFNVGEDPVVATFTLSAPSATIADGDSIEIPFKAETADGKAITSFRTIAKQKTFNTVTFNASDGNLDLVETDTGAAKLVWTDKTMPWSDPQTTDGIDRPVLLTVIVVGGEGDNERIDVQDKRRPDSIADVKMDKAYVADATITLTNTSSFQFYDQYGALIDEDGDATDYGDDNGFFDAAADLTTLKGTGFAGYAFGVRIKNAGSGAITYDTAESDAPADNITAEDLDGDTYVVTNETKAVFNTDPTVQTAQTNEGFKFEIAKIDTEGDLDPTLSTDWEALSSSKYFQTAVVPISAVKNLYVDELDTFYVGSLDVTGDKIIASSKLADLKDTALTVTANEDGGIYGGNTKTYDQNIIVKGTYNGLSVTVPAHYYEISANKLKATGNNTKGDDGTERNFDAIIPYDEDDSPKGLQAADLYDKTTSKGVFKLATDEVTATVYDLYGEGDAPYFWKWNATNLVSEKVNLTSTTTPATQYATAQATYSDTAKTNAETKLGNAAAVEVVNTLVPNAKVGTDAVTTNNVGTWITENTDAEALDVETAKQYVADKQTAYNNKETALSAARGELTPAQIAAADVLVGDDAALMAKSDDDLEGDVYSDPSNPTDDENKELAYLKAKRDALKAADALTDAEDDLDKAVKNDAAEKATEAKTTAVAAVGEEFTEKKAANTAAQTTGITQMSVYDTAKATITLSDQAPYAYEITGLAESYTFTPTLTKVTYADIAEKLEKVKVLDQYGVTYKGLGDIDLTVSNVSENKDGWADNNFKINENGTTATNLEGAELGDTFTLVASYGELKKSTAVTVGADKDAKIHNSTNVFLDTLIGNGKDGALENQRLDGLK